MADPLILDLAACNSIRGVLEGALERDDAASLRGALAQLAAADAAGRIDELKQSKLARLVKKRVARYADPQIASAARQLVADWFALFDIPDAAPAPAPAASSKAPPPGAEVIDLDTDDDEPAAAPPPAAPPPAAPPPAAPPPAAPPAAAAAPEGGRRRIRRRHHPPVPAPAAAPAAAAGVEYGGVVGGFASATASEVSASEHSAAEDDMEDGEVAPAARFSDGEVSPVSPTSPVREAARAAGGRRPAASAADAGRSGFDFSGAASADAWQRTCPICGEPLELEYSTRRHELVVPGAVTLNHRTYHEACIAARAMPSAG